MTSPSRRVVVIDSGVDASHPAVRGRGTVVAGPAFGPDGPLDADGGGVDQLGHGTAVAGTILQWAPGIELVSLRVFDAAATCDFAAVLQALDHALVHAPQVVNLSLGTTSLRHHEALRGWVARARAAGVRITAPISYGGLPCAPGNLPGVDAVVADPNVLGSWPELRRHGDGFVWFASPLPPRAADGTRPLRARGDSLAVAAVTGCLLRSWSG